jgi:transposase
MITKEVWVDIQALHRQGRSIRQIARELGLSRKTVRRYLRNPQPPRYVRSQRKPGILDPHKEYLLSRVGKLPDLPAPVLLRELRARGYTGQITLIKDFIRPIRAERRRLQELTVRYETVPGEQAQVDWGEFLRLPDGRKLYGLSLVLSWSRTMFVYFTCRMVLQELLQGLRLGFEYFGGWPRKLLLDNPKTVVLQRGPTVADSTLHPRFLDFLGHHALELQLCEPRRPQTKGKVERPMQYIAHSLVLPNSDRWSSPEEANRDARIWLDTVANVRVHGTTGERPLERLPREGLVPFSSARLYDLTWMGARRVHKDCHFSWEGNRYSVPWQHGSTSVLVRRHPGGVLEVERDGEIIARHRERIPGGRQNVTLPEHLAGLWQRTLGGKRTHEPPAEVAALDRVCLFPEVEVQQRHLSVYQHFLEEVVS